MMMLLNCMMLLHVVEAGGVFLLGHGCETYKSTCPRIKESSMINFKIWVKGKNPRGIEFLKYTSF